MKDGFINTGDEVLENTYYKGLPDGEYLFGIRPEDIHPSEDGPFFGKAEVVETLGNENIIYLKFAGRQFAARCSPRITAAPGDMFGFSIDYRRSHLFDIDGIRVKRTKT